MPLLDTVEEAAKPKKHSRKGRVLDAPETPVTQAQMTRHVAMRAAFAAQGFSAAKYHLEVLEVARAAADDGDYSAAFKGYELVGKALGVFAPELQAHLHVHNATSRDALVSMSDEALRAMIERAKAPAIEAKCEVVTQPETTPVPELAGVLDA